MKSPDSPGRFIPACGNRRHTAPIAGDGCPAGSVNLRPSAGGSARACAARMNGKLATMTYELDPQTPDEFDGDITSTLDSGLAGTAGYDGRSNGAPPRVGDLSDLNENDKRLYDEFLATLR